MPPKLIPEQEIEIGREIALKGRDFFLHQAPYLTNDEQRRIENAKHQTKAQKIKIIVIAILFFGPCFALIFSTQGYGFRF